VEPTVETLDHFSAMAGVKTKDRTVTVTRSATLAMTLEEWTPENLALAFLGEVSQDSNGHTVVSGLTQDLIRGQIEAEMSNDVGPRYYLTIPSVAIKPNSELGIISDEWASFDLEGEIEAVNGSFWTARLIGGEAGTESEAASESESA
jgi:hypothetical protein